MTLYHIGFSKQDLGNNLPQLALLSGEPERSRYLAETFLQNSRLLSDYRGLNSYLGYLSNGKPVLVATSGMGAPSLSIVVNELVQVGIKQIIRIGTCGSIQPHVQVGSIVISQGALCRQGAANDIAPLEYPAVADPFLTVALVETAQKLNIPYHLGITASVDTFYEGQERQESSANPNLQAWLLGITQQYRNLNILNYEMEAGTLFKMGSVYGFAAACVCGVVAQRTQAEDIILKDKDLAVNRAIQVAVAVDC
ncbi:purine or other phosphorylase family 1 [Stanieria cyanosphaera PCC 7437]|uniref:Uridine phosphorylase n=1 Tax=Stanieria cyanosphaera (strain ATCC 29371 / PCC 7437) TaxID=111780 RepID=K9XTU6_STAC7|nr:nucleoside phosphorylase [Stanieria cyanosphaera]AFZ35973.1 purine or other phosphorylase family 1 [Stanieria cyanosphaera PCC 7437]